MKTEIIITIETNDDGTVNVRCEQPAKKIEDSGSIYAKVFDEKNQYWSTNPKTNLMFLKLQEMYANDLLRSKGHVFLNEVYDMLGFPCSSKGQVVGWTYNKHPFGDNCIRFDIYNDRNSKFINGAENVAFLDFNVDGCILEFID